MPIAVSVSFFNPFWSTLADTRGWFYDGAPGAGVTHTNATAHPFASALGEYVITFDGNSAVHVAKPWNLGSSFQDDAVYGVGTQSNAVAPDSTRRWGIRRAFLFRYTGTNTSAALIAQSRSSTTGLFLNTDGTVTFTFTDSLLVTESFTSTGTLAADTWYLIDMWCVTKSASGANLPQYQLVVRSSTLSAGAQGTVTTLINTLVNGTTTPLSPPGSNAGGLSPAFGENNTRGAGFAFRVCNVYSGWEDADDPYGVVRGDRLDPTGLSALNNQWSGTDFADVDESGTAEPDDVTTIDAITYNPGGVEVTKDQTYTLSNTAIATGSGDLVIRPVVALKVMIANNVPFKGAFIRFRVMESDGTNNVVGQNQVFAAQNSFLVGYESFPLSPASAAWTTTNLNSLETGERADSNDTASNTYTLSTVTTLVAYQASGETMPAVPGAPPARPSVFVRQAVSRSNVY